MGGTANQWAQVQLIKAPSTVVAYGTAHTSNNIWTSVVGRAVEKLVTGDQISVTITCGVNMTLQTGRANLFQVDYLGTG